MTTINAVVRDGRTQTQEPLDLPDGTELLIPVPGNPAVEQDAWDDSPEGIAAWLAWADSLEPLIFTDDELAAWNAAQQVRTDWEKSKFDEYAAKVKRVWE